METNLYCCTRTGRTISEKTMEDGNIVNTNDDKIASGSLASLYGDRPVKLTANGHDFAGEPPSPSESARERRPSVDAHNDKFRKRINPLRIHLGKRPFVDSAVNNRACKKRKPIVNRPSDPCATKKSAPRAPKLIPKQFDRSQYHNVPLHIDNERDKPVPRLVPKSQLQLFKKGKIEKGPQLKEYAQSLGLQPMVKFKCRKCCSMSFKTLAMLKEHQLVCQAQAKEPALSPEAAPSTEPGSGPSRVTRKVYLCSACGTYYENWNLFLHMREVHNRHICLFCLGMFSKAEKLSSHLMNKHNVQEFNYSSKEEFCKVYNGTLYLMCCACDEICSEQDDFFNHDCNNVKPKPKPVPVLVNKNTGKPNNLKLTKSFYEQTANGPTTIGKDKTNIVSDKKDLTEVKPETYTSQLQKSVNIPNFEPYSNVHTSLDSIATSSMQSTSYDHDSDSSLEHANKRMSPVQPVCQNLNSNAPSVPNGDENLDQSDESDTPDSDIPSPAVENLPNKTEEPVTQPTQPVEKEGGIKLKLSLNNAKSPVIINSTVDPTVGQQYANKPPTRTRRPPKRYEKPTPVEPVPPVKPPSIKMTICDRADSPFVKTTIIENNKETTLKTLINNNLETEPKPVEIKSENTMKTTIYDNKLEDVNTLNRVPKLTVRVPKEFLDKDSSSDYSSDSDVSEKLAVDDLKPDTTVDEAQMNSTPSTKEVGVALEEPILEQLPNSAILKPSLPCEESSQEEEIIKTEPECKTEVEPAETLQTPDENIDCKPELKTEPPEQDTSAELNIEDLPATGDCDIPITELTLDRPIDKYPLKDLLKVFLASTVFNCIYCNHVRKIAVNCEQLALHMVAEHRFSATVDSITAEELMPETIKAKVKAGAEELCSIYINLDSYDSVDKCENVQYSHLFECFQCYFKTAVHKDLCLHNRKMHQKTILLCVMCKNNFYSYSELLCHLCPGTYNSDYETKFRCCFCNVDTISSSFRLMVHLRKIHHTCDVCLEFCQSQARLSNHVWKHKLHHLCYRCGIAYRNKLDITNHLFWKHGTESVLCKRCLQKKWPHVYHFCTPPAIFNCDECSLQFSRAVYLKVHKRFHSQEFPHACTELDCTEKFVSKKLLNKHIEEHKKKLLLVDITEESMALSNGNSSEEIKEPTPVIDLVDDKPKEEAGSSEIKTEAETEPMSKKSKKKKLKDKDALLLDMNLPALNLSESDSSDESDSGAPASIKDEKSHDNPSESTEEKKVDANEKQEPAEVCQESTTQPVKYEDEKSQIPEDEKPDEKQVLEIWDNFQKYQAKVEKHKEKTPPLVPIRKHVCESDHDYCVVPTDLNGDEDMFSLDKKKSKKSPKKRHGDLSSSSSSSSDSDSSCSCRSNCSCSSSSGSSSSSSSDSDSSDGSSTEKKKTKTKKSLPSRRISNGSNVDVMGMSETPVLVPEKPEPLIAETDLDTEESETDEEFYDKNPQQLTNKLQNEKKLILASLAPSDGGSVSTEVSRCTTPVKEEIELNVQQKESEPKEEMKEEQLETKEKSSSKKKSKKKKRSKSSKKHGPIKINIPKDVIAKSEVEIPRPLAPNKITISLQSNTVQIPETPKPVATPTVTSTPVASSENKRASKRRRVPNKFYGYSSDEETPPSVTAALKPQLPPKLEWRKEDLPSPVTHKPKKEVPSLVIPQRLFSYTEPIRLSTPIPDPEPPRILMNTESMDSSDSDSSGEGNLEIYQPNSVQSSYPVPPPTYLNSGTSSLPYPFQRPAVRQAREGESVYCYCRCPYDEVSEMIACDAEGCSIEWFHFECVGIMVPPKGKWYCPECRKNQSFSGFR